jgi:hypothetical protein
VRIASTSIGLRAGCRDRRPLDWDGEDFSTLRDQRRLLAGHEVEEARDRGEPAVARADRALAFVLGVTEERADLAGGEISQGDLRDPAALPFRDEPEEQPPGVAIGPGGMDGCIALLGRPFIEERAQQRGDFLMAEPPASD